MFICVESFCAITFGAHLCPICARAHVGGTLRVSRSCKKAGETSREPCGNYKLGNCPDGIAWIASELYFKDPRWKAQKSDREHSSNNPNHTTKDSRQWLWGRDLRALVYLTENPIFSVSDFTSPSTKCKCLCTPKKTRRSRISCLRPTYKAKLPHHHPSTLNESSTRNGRGLRLL